MQSLLKTLALTAVVFLSTGTLAQAEENSLSADPHATSVNLAGSYYNWGRSQDGYARCYHYSPNGLVLDQGTAASNYRCQ